MNNIDIAILVVWGLAAFNGWRRGLVVSLFSITGAAVGAYIGHGFIAKFAHASQPDMIKVGIILSFFYYSRIMISSKFNSE
jgi:uncharacterized membrane protein required for colicin V production